jgi:hypothetical protein
MFSDAPHTKSLLKTDCFLRCDYDEYDPYSYRGVVLDIYEGGYSPEAKPETKRFDTGHPLRDKNKAIEDARMIGDLKVMSSWDNFVSDVMTEFTRVGRMHAESHRPKTSDDAIEGQDVSQSWMRVMLTQLSAKLSEVAGNSNFIAAHFPPTVPNYQEQDLEELGNTSLGEAILLLYQIKEMLAEEKPILDYIRERASH